MHIKIFNFTHLKLTKNRIVSFVFLRRRFFAFMSKMNSLDRAFVIAIIDCVSFIVVYQEVADQARQQSRTNEAEDVAAHVDQERS